MFGFIKKAFKGVGKVFKKIGKGIMKGFKAIGKFANKMGIFGQVGMMLLTGGIANAAFGAMSTMGAGFMQGLSQSSNIVAKMAYSTLTGIKTVVAAPLKIGSSVFKNVTKGAFSALKDVGSHMSNKMFGTTFSTSSTGSLWDSLGKVGSKYGGNIAKDTSAALGDAGNFLKDAVGKGPVKSDFRTFTPVGAEDPVTKNLAYNSSAREQFKASILSQRPDANSTILDRMNFKDDPMNLRDTPIGNFKALSNENLFKDELLNTVDPLTDKITTPNFKALKDPTIGAAKPVGSMLARAKAGASQGFANTFSKSGLTTTGGTALTQQLYGSSMTTDAPVDTSLQIQPTRNLFNANLQKATAGTPTQFFNSFINSPQETFNTPNFQPINYNQWMNINSPSYV